MTEEKKKGGRPKKAADRIARNRTFRMTDDDYERYVTIPAQKANMEKADYIRTKLKL